MTFRRAAILTLAILGGLSSLALILYFSGVEPDELYLNLGTEFVGILVTVVVVDGLIRFHEHKRREQIRKVALGSLRRPIQRHVALLASMFKAATNEPPPESHKDLRSLLGPGYWHTVKHLDFSRPAPTSPSMSWLRYVSIEVTSLVRDIERVLNTYSIQLDPDEVQHIQGLATSSLSSLLHDLGGLDLAGREEFALLRDPSMEQSTLEHVSLTLKVAECVGQFGGAALTTGSVLWSDNIAPDLGSGRL